MESSVLHPSLEEASQNIRGAENQNFWRYSHFPTVSQKKAGKWLEIYQVHAFPSKSILCLLYKFPASQGHWWPSAAVVDTRWASAAEGMRWFRRHYGFIFICFWKTEWCYSHSRGEEGSTGIEDLNQTLAAARGLARIQQDRAWGGPSCALSQTGPAD